MSAASFSIAFLCTGNRFRSPLAAAFVGTHTRALPVSITTAATAGASNAPALPEATEIALFCGLDLSRHRSCRLVPGSLEAIDVVIGFEEAHVRRAVVDGAAGRSRTFTLPELITLLRAVDVPTGLGVTRAARARVEAAGRVRREQPELVADLAPIPDPYGGSRRLYLEVARDTRALSLELVTQLFDIPEPRLPDVPSELRARSVSLRRQMLRSLRRRFA